MIERIQLAHLPTPIEHLSNLTRILKGPDLYVKRDDLTGLGLGGNKTRKLEYLTGDALAQDSETLISAGAIQSNHCRQVAAAAAKLGLACILVLTGKKPHHAEGNLLLDRLSGAEVVFVPEQSQRDAKMAQVFEKTKKAGLNPYLIPYGGSNAVGALAYANAMHELKQQGCEPDWIVFATSSGGTQAGLVLGAHQTDFHGKVLGISIDQPAEEFFPVVERLVIEASALTGEYNAPPTNSILINSDYCTAGYGVLQPAEVEAIHLFASREGILLDPVYTGRAAAGLIDLIRKGFFRPSEKVLFWHTGGAPALFAEPYQGALQT